MDDKTKEQLTRLYLSPSDPGSFSSPLRLYKEAKKRGLDVTSKDVREFLKGRASYNQHLMTPSRHVRGRLIASCVDDSWMSDIMYNPRPAQNRGFLYSIILVDVLTDFLWVIPIRNKTTATVTREIYDLFRRSGRHPSMLTTDLGTEYRSHLFEAMLKQERIIHHLARGKNKASLAEAYIKFVRLKIGKYCTANKTRSYVDALPDITKGMNSTPLRSLDGLAPDQIDVYNQNRVWKYRYQKLLARKPPEAKLRVGERVRLKLFHESTFKKSSDPSFSQEIFVVAEIHSAPPTLLYSIKDVNGRPVEGRWYYESLSPVFDDGF